MTNNHASMLPALPDELQLLILSHLDIPELLAISRTTHHLRILSLDPLLHGSRLHAYRLSLSYALPSRPPLASIRPPSRSIYLTPVQNLARALGRQLISIRLKRSLSRRPAPDSLVDRNVLPERCYGGGVAPGLVGIKRRVERERVKDCLRGWLGGAGWKERIKSLKSSGLDGSDGERSVRGLVRRFTAWRNAATAAVVPAGRRWTGAESKARKLTEEPARAHVLGLRRFWEELASPIVVAKG